MGMFWRYFLIIFTWVMSSGAAFAQHQPQTQGKPADRSGNLVGHGGPVKAVAISKNGKFALTGSFDYAAMLWNISKGKTPQLINRFADHNGAVNAVAFVENQDRFVSAGDDGAVYLWDAKSAKLLQQFSGHQAKVVSLAVSGDQRLVASASWDRTIRLWDLTSLKPAGVLKGHKGPVNAVLFSGDNRFVYSSSYDGTINKWRVGDGVLIRPVHRHGWGINVMAWLPGKTKIAFGTIDGHVQIYDLEANEVAKILIPHQRPVLALAVSKDGKYLASGGGDGVVRVWQMSDWSVVEELHSSFGPVWSMDFSDSSHIYYAGLDDYVVAWTVSPREIGKEVQGKFPRRFQKLKNMSLGERQFARKCSVCHTLKPGDANRAGPSLSGIFGRRAGTLKNYAYSRGLLTSDIIWNEDTIDKLFLHGPQIVTPGSKMPLQRISQKEKRQALIKFLKSQTK